MKQKEQRLPIFAERLRELQGEKSNTEFAAYLGMSRQTVGFYLNGNRIPDAIVLRQIAERCAISTDWLLGLTDVTTLDQSEKEICDYTGLTLESVRVLHCANDVLKNDLSQELTRHIQMQIEKEKEHCAAQKKIIEQKREIANHITAMADNDFLYQGIAMISDIFAEYTEKIDERDIYETETEKINVYRELLNQILYRLDSLLIRYTFDQSVAEMVTAIEGDALRGNAELLLDAINFGLSSNSAQEIFRSIALVVYGKDEENNQRNYVDSTTRYGSRSTEINSSDLAAVSLILNLQKDLLHEREVREKRYKLTVEN